MSVHDSALKKVMAKVFEISEEQITTECSPDTLEQWDSLKHMELIVEIENYFKLFRVSLFKSSFCDHCRF